MTQIAKEGTFENAIGGSNGEVKTRAPRNYKITVESFEQQIKQLEPKELFALQHTLQVELDKRRAEADALVEELKGGKA